MNARRRRLGVTAAVVVLLLTTLGSGPFASPSAPSAIPSGTAGSPLASPAIVLGAPPVTAGPTNSSFFLNSPIPLPPSADRPCQNGTATGSCPLADELNITVEPSAVVTPSGEVAVAYTALTDQSPCPAAQPYSETNIGFVTSSNGGANWSSPVYLGDPDCSSAAEYPSAWQPAIAALGNGTLVLAYVEYNLTGRNTLGNSLPPWWNPLAPPPSRLVLTESYDGGANWSSPDVLNVSTNRNYSGVYFAPARPSIATTGSTIYIAWERLGLAKQNPSQNGLIALRVSTNGGSTWSPTVPITTGYAFSQNPSLLVTPKGRLFLGYDTYPSGASSALTHVAVATSTSNGTLFTTYTIPMLYRTVPLLGPFAAPSVSLAYSATYGRLYVGFTAMDHDAHGAYGPQLELVSTANDGRSWQFSPSAPSAAYDPGTSVSGTTSSGVEPGVYAASVAVDPRGNLDVNALVENESLCRMGQCGMMTDVELASSNNATSFSPARLVNGNITPGNGSWFGEDTATVVANGTPLVLYPSMNCPVWPRANCTAYPGPGELEQSRLTAATPFQGPGFTVTFHAVGLNSTTIYSVLANNVLYFANGSTDLNLTGFPRGEVLFWSVFGINASGSVRFYPTNQSRSSESPITSNVTDTISYAAYYPIEIELPSSARSLTKQDCATFDSYVFPPGITNLTYGCTTPVSPTCWLPTYYYSYNGGGRAFTEMDWNVYCTDLVVQAAVPLGEVDWMPAGTHLNASVYPRNYWAEIFNSSNGPCTNPSGNISYSFLECDLFTSSNQFVSWTGSGNSSVSTNQSSIQIVLDGPAYETVNVLPTGACTGYLEWTATRLYNTTNCYQLTAGFEVRESGLPNGVRWGFSLTNLSGMSSYNETSPQPYVLNDLPVGEQFDLSAWTIPTSAPLEYWVPTLPGGSTVITSFTGTVEVDYQLENVTDAIFNVTASEQGLPGGVDWSYSLNSGPGGATYNESSSSGSSSTIPLGYASDYLFTGGTVYRNSSISFYVLQVNLTVLTENATPISNRSPSFALTGDVVLTVEYAPEYWVEVEASGGGSATPASGWVPSGTSVRLTATPRPGDYFVGWTGIGLGATTASERHESSLSIRPDGPVTELAVFAPTPSPTYVATFQPTGLPVDQRYTVILGSDAYSGVGVFSVGNLSEGSYALSVPYVYDNTTAATRYVMGSWNATWGVEEGSVEVTMNGTVLVTFTTQFLLTVGSAGPDGPGSGGNTSPGSGASWKDAGAGVELTALPDPGDHLESWGGTGPGSVNTTATSFQLVVDGPLSEVAEFAANPATAPARYSLTVTETGLPAGEGWSAMVLGEPGTFSTNSTARFTGLPGSRYTLMVPMVVASPGVRYVPSGTGNYSVPVSSNTSFTVNFSEQFLLSVEAAGNGTMNVTGGWFPFGATVTLGASPAAGWAFSDWSGSGLGSYSGLDASSVVTLNGPVEETATFAPAYSPPASRGSPSAGLPLAVGLLVALLAAGLVVGGLLARRRSAPADGPTEETPTPEEELPSEDPEEGSG